MKSFGPDWTGTDDPTACLSIPECLRVLGGLLPGGMAALMERNHALALRGRDIVLEALGLAPPPCPDSLIGSMAALLLPAAGPASPVGHGLDAGAWHRGMVFPLALPGREVGVGADLQPRGPVPGARLPAP